MKPKTFLKLLLMVCACACFSSIAHADEKPEKVARDIAEKWLALVDAGKFADSWQSAAEYFQKAVTSEQWTRSLEAVRTPLGALTTRTFKNATFEKKLPGAPDGEYFVMKFETSFANKKEAVETVVPMKEKDGSWKVSGYFIK